MSDFHPGSVRLILPFLKLLLLTVTVVVGGYPVESSLECSNDVRITLFMCMPSYYD